MTNIFSTLIAGCLSHQLNHSLTQSPSWETNSNSANQQNSSPFMEPEGPVPCSREPRIGPYPELDESRRSILILFCLRLAYSTDLLPSNF